MPRDDFSTVPAARGPLPWLRCGILSVSTTEVANAWREDEPRPCLPLDGVFANAPDRDDDYFRTPPA